MGCGSSRSEQELSRVIATIYARPGPKLTVRQLRRLTRVAVEDFTHLEHWQAGPLQV